MKWSVWNVLWPGPSFQIKKEKITCITPGSSWNHLGPLLHKEIMGWIANCQTSFCVLDFFFLNKSHLAEHFSVDEFRIHVFFDLQDFFFFFKSGTYSVFLSDIAEASSSCFSSPGSDCSPVRIIIWLVRQKLITANLN